MTRAERNRSKLFPTSEEGSIWAGETKNLTYETGHFTGSKTIAGKLVVPGEQEGKFRIEVGEPTFRGVEYVGGTNGLVAATGIIAVGPDSNVQTGDLMVLFVEHLSTVQGQAVTPGAGWTRVWNRELVTNVAWGAIFMRIRQEDDLDFYNLGIVSDLDNAEDILFQCNVYRNAQIQHEDDLNLVETSGTNAGTVTFTELTNVPRGSYAVQAVFSGDAADVSPTHSVGTGFTEVIDTDVELGSGVGPTAGLAIAHKAIPTAGTVDLSNVTISGATMDTWYGLGIVIEPKTSGIYGWTGETGSEKFFINEHGTASFKNLIGDTKVSGVLRYQKPLALVCKNSNQAAANGSRINITFATPTIDDWFLFNDTTDAFDFDGVLHRGLWRVELFVTWLGNTTVGARFLAEIEDTTAGGTVVARDNRRAAAAGIDCARAVYICPVTEDTSLEFYATHNGGAGIDVEGLDNQAATHIYAEYLRDLD